MKDLDKPPHKSKKIWTLVIVGLFNTWFAHLHTEGGDLDSLLLYSGMAFFAAAAAAGGGQAYADIQGAKNGFKEKMQAALARVKGPKVHSPEAGSDSSGSHLDPARPPDV